MTRHDRFIIASFFALLFTIGMFILFVPKAKGQPAPAPISVRCPPDAKSCKVIVLTPEQESILDQIITNTCIAGPYAQIADVVKFYKEMLAKAPQGAQGTPTSSTAPTPAPTPAIK